MGHTTPVACACAGEAITGGFGPVIRMAADRVLVYQSGKQTENPLYSSEGAIAVHPEMVALSALVPAGLGNGCCGSDGIDGPNRACTCGQMAATE